MWQTFYPNIQPHIKFENLKKFEKKVRKRGKKAKKRKQGYIFIFTLGLEQKNMKRETN